MRAPGDRSLHPHRAPARGGGARARASSRDERIAAPHAQVDARAAPRCAATANGPALLLLHGLGERSPARAAREPRAPGPVPSARSTSPATARRRCRAAAATPRSVLMGDADAALARARRGDAASAAGSAPTWRCCSPARARGRCAARSSATDPASPAAVPARQPRDPLRRSAAQAPPDPFALVELARDVRPPDYATTFVRLATELSGLARPVSVCAVERPEWLRAVLEEPGVRLLLSRGSPRPLRGLLSAALLRAQYREAARSDIRVGRLPAVQRRSRGRADGPVPEETRHDAPGIPPPQRALARSRHWPWRSWPPPRLGARCQPGRAPRGGRPGLGQRALHEPAEQSRRPVSPRATCSTSPTPRRARSRCSPSILRTRRC